jgi:hypothetical protein
MDYFKNLKKLEKGKSLLFKREGNPIVDLFADEKDVKIRIFDEKQEIFSDFDGTAIKEILNEIDEPMDIEIDFFYRGIAVKCLKEIKEIFIDFFNDRLEHLNNVRELAGQLSGIEHYEKINVYGRRENCLELKRKNGKLETVFIANFREFQKPSFEIEENDGKYLVKINTEDKRELFETYNYIGTDAIKKILNSEILKKFKEIIPQNFKEFEYLDFLIAKELGIELEADLEKVLYLYSEAKTEGYPLTVSKTDIKNIEKIEIKFNSLRFIPSEEMATEEMFELADKILEKFSLSEKDNILIERDYKVKSIHFNNGYFRLNFPSNDGNVMELAKNLQKKSGFSVKLNGKVL